MITKRPHQNTLSAAEAMTSLHCRTHAHAYAAQALMVCCGRFFTLKITMHGYPDGGKKRLVQRPAVFLFWTLLG